MIRSNELGVYTESIDFKKPIPVDAGNVIGWKRVPVEAYNEKLVPLGVGSDYPEIFSSSIYFGERTDSPYYGDSFDGSLISMFVRSSVADRLRKANSLLPPHFHLVVYDTYRTIEVQKSLFDRFASALAIVNPTFSEEKIIEYTQKFVSLPSLDPTKPSPHNTGGAVDLAIACLSDDAEDEYQKLIRQSAQETDSMCRYILHIEASTLFARSAHLLDFGTAFDYGGVEASLRYYEELLTKKSLNKSEEKILNNRRMLYNLMRSVGFGAYADEWWHFNAPETQMGAVDLKKPFATLGAATLAEDNISHERKRRKYWHRLARLNEVESPFSRDTLLVNAFVCLMRIASTSAGGKATSLSTAVELVPPAVN